MSKKQEETLDARPVEEISPSAISTPKEAQQSDDIRILQRQIAELTGVVAKMSKKTGTKTQLAERNADGFGFVRTIDGVPITSWRMKPGSYVTINQFGQEDDQQYMVIETSDGKKHEMHYREFDQRTKVGQIKCRIHDYCYKNDLGEWRPKRRSPMDKVTITLSEDGGTTYTGQEMEAFVYLLN